MDDTFVIQIKNLEIEVAQTGVRYSIESIADWIIPKSVVENSLQNRDGSTEVVRRVVLEDGTTFDVVITLRQAMLSNLISKSDSYIPTFTSYLYSISVEEDPCSEFKAPVAVRVKSYSPTRGGVSILNGILGINW